MKKNQRKQLLLLVITLLILPGLYDIWPMEKTVNAQVIGNNVLYTADEDFDQGTLVSVNHDAPNNDQLQLDSPTEPFPFINVAASGRGTVVRANTETGEIVGEYRTAPEGRGLNPSRTTVDLFGNVWTANRNEDGMIDGVPHGSAVKIGLIVGGSRVDENGNQDANGGYLAPPFGYNTCVDRDGDGLIRTSKGLNDILDWPDITDGSGGVDGIVQDAEDECILIYQRLYDAEQSRHVSVDADNNVWVGGYPFELRMFYKLDGNNGVILDSFDARDIGCGGYGGLIDGNGILWSVGGALLRYDPATKSGFCIPHYGYGLGIDTSGYIWMSMWDGGIVKIAPDGTVMPGFPKPTYPPSMTGWSLNALDTRNAIAELPLNEAMIPTSTLIEKPSFTMESPLSNKVATVDEPLAADPSVTFQVAPVDEWVSSTSTWTPGATITLTIADGSGIVYSDAQTANGDGNFNFNLWDVFDLQRGQVVTVSDGTTTKTHTVMDLYVDGVDVTNDTIFGRAGAGTGVDLWVHGDGYLSVTADSSGKWVADFSGITDLTYLSDGGSQQTDDDGDSTGVWWASPRFRVAPVDEWVQSQSAWTPGATISLTIEDGGGGVVYSDTQKADTEGYFNFNLWDVFDLQRGQVVTVSDGTTTKTHTVTDLYVDGVDVTADTVFGRADAGTSVEVWVHGNGGVATTTDGSGNWTADFSGITDLTYLSDGGSAQTDSDGDSTGVWWASPKFQVAPVDDWVQSVRPWTPGSTISLTIEDGSGVLYSDTQSADADGNFHFDLWDVFDLQRGQLVTVSDGTTTKTHTVTDLYVDGVDVTADTVFGRADVGTSVDVWVHSNGNLTATADSSGSWIADFSGMTDLTYGSDGGSQQTDADGDSTGIWWASPSFRVSPDNDWVQARQLWTPGTTISLRVEDGGVMVFSDTQTADADGYFDFDLWGVFDLQRGQVVTVSDGIITKTHTVTNLYFDSINVATDTVFGRADPGTSVAVWVNGNGQLTVIADEFGDWEADFSSMVDITYLSDGSSRQADNDGDITRVDWSTPSFQAAPEDNWVGSWNRWKPGATISLTIEDSGTVVYSDSETADSHGNFDFDVSAINLVPGQQVTVSDETTTKTHTVIDISVVDIDTDADQIRGTASPGARIWVWAHLFDNGSGRSATADPSGDWNVDFSVAGDGQPIYDITSITRINVNEFDDDGDSSSRQFGPPVQQNRGVAVTPINNNVWLASSGYGTVTRLDNEGNIIKVIDTGLEPTGVAIDAAGKVWAANMSSNNAVRIDPNAGSDGLGAIDLTVDLGPDAWPYNYSDMTGAVVVGSTSPQGFWSVIQDSQTPGFEWGRIIWNTEPEGSEPTGTAIVVEARVADTEAGLGGQQFQIISNGDLFSMSGRFIEVRVTLKASPGGVSPVLSDIRVQPHVIYASIDIKPESCPNPLNMKEKAVLPVAIMGLEDFDVTQIDPTTIRLFRKGIANPIEVTPLRWSLEDAGTPYEPFIGRVSAYDCLEYHPDEYGVFDGYLDLLLKFKAQEVGAALGEVNDGDVLVLQLSGKLKEEYGGIEFIGEDVVWILKK